MIMFIPVDKDEIDMCINSSLYGDSCSRPQPYFIAKSLGYKIIKIIDEFFIDEVPKKWIDSDEAWWGIKGWNCEVEKL